MKAKILHLLKESDSYVSGQQLCDRFDVSRTAIWKVMEQLKEEGYKIEAVRNRGYRLDSSPDVISRAEISSYLKTKWAAQELICYSQTDSTNIRARDAGEHGFPHGTLVVADRQDGGKGRRGRSWVSPSGTGIYMSLLLRPDILPVRASMLTLVMGLSVAEVIRGVLGDVVQIKWPNDIITGGKKICGILTEMSTEIEQINYVVIGVGINVNQRDFPEEVAQKATSLRIEAGETFRRSSLIAAVMKHFEKNYRIFLETEDFSGLQRDYEAMLVNRGRMVKVLEPGNEYEARAEGIDRMGQLVVTLPDGKKKTIFAGEVSVRGLAGYV